MEVIIKNKPLTKAPAGTHSLYSTFSIVQIINQAAKYVFGKECGQIMTTALS